MLKHSACFKHLQRQLQSLLPFLFTLNKCNTCICNCQKLCAVYSTTLLPSSAFKTPCASPHIAWQFTLEGIQGGHSVGGAPGASVTQAMWLHVQIGTPTNPALSTVAAAAAAAAALPVHDAAKSTVDVALCG